jgi:hypothetical protein
MRGQGFGITFGGGPEGMMLRSMPEMEGSFQRMNIESFPRVRMEQLMREMDMAPMRMRLRENGSYRTLSPSRVRVIGPEGSRYIYRDSTGSRTSAKTKEERAKAAKALKAEKEKEKK